MSVATTCAPSAMNARASAAPWPRAPPVMIATLPRSRSMAAERSDLRPGHADDWFVGVDPERGAEERCVAVAEHATVHPDQPVPPPRRGRDEANDPGTEVGGGRRPEERRVAEREDTAVGRHDPVPAPRWCGRDAHRPPPGPQRGAEEGSVPEREHAAV